MNKFADLYKKKNSYFSAVARHAFLPEYKYFLSEDLCLITVIKFLPCGLWYEQLDILSSILIKILDGIWKKKSKISYYSVRKNHPVFSCW